MATRTGPPKTRLVTAEDLLAMGDIGPSELVEGRIVRMSPTGSAHGWIESYLAHLLSNFVLPRNLGWLLTGEPGIYIRRNPDTVRAADVAFVSRQRTPQLPRGYLDVAPELVVEIMSPGDLWQDVRSKLHDYFSIGVDQVWIVEPERQTVLLYRSPTDSEEFTLGDVLQGEGILQGFELPVASLFAEL